MKNEVSEREKRMRVRNIQGEDYVKIHSVLNDWWGRDMAAMLPKLFFVHFQETSFIIEEDGETLGFLCGFFSQTHKEEAYVHFIGVNPKYRRRGIASTLYSYFFDVARANNRKVVKAITSPVNKNRYSFIKKSVFELRLGMMR